MSDFWQSELPGIPKLPSNGSTETRRTRLSRLDVPDAIWPTDNDCEIPLLNLRLQADAIDRPVVAWGSVARTTEMSGTWHFYVDDRRFRALWKDPTRVVKSGCVCAVEPNFSCHDQTPVAVGLYRIHQKRWLARYWQSKGIRILADLNVGEKFLALNMLGIPIGWRAYATRGYTDHTESTLREWQIARERARTDDILFLVYGGGKKVRYLCRERGWVWIAERADAVKFVNGRPCYEKEGEESPGTQEDL
jgi:hypothetical protein